MKARDLQRLGCRSRRGDVAAFVAGRLPLESLLELERHAESCAPCKTAIEFERLVEEALARDAASDFDAGFEARIAADWRRRATLAAPPRPKLSRLRPAVAVVVLAAAVVLALRIGGELVRSEPSGTETAFAPLPSPPTPTASTSQIPIPLVSDAVEPSEERRAAVREEIRAVLRESASRADHELAATWTAGTLGLGAERWPLDEWLVSAIDDSDPLVAASAMRTAAALELVTARPRIARAARRDEVAPTALLALGTLRDHTALPRFERALEARAPALRHAACEALSRLGSRPAARVLATRLDDPGLADVALAALVACGEPGVEILLARAARGDVAAREALAAAQLPADRQLLPLLATAEPITLRLVVDLAPRLGDLAVAPLISHLRGDDEALRIAAHRALVAIGGRATARSLLAHVANAAGDGVDPALARALVATLDGELGGEARLRDLAAEDDGESLLSALAAVAGADRDPRALAMLAAIASDDRSRLAIRAAAVTELAALRALDPASLTALLAAATLERDAGALAELAIAAAHAGLRLERDDHLALTTPVLAAAERLAERWRRSGEPPDPAARESLARRIERAMP
jgi:hypothetical protein